MHQGSLFDLLATPVSGNSVKLAGVLPSIRAEMYRVADEYAPGRKMLAEAISKVARKEGLSLTSTGAKSVSEELLDKWLQPGATGHEPSLKAILCFCIATGSFAPLGPAFALAGLAVIPQSDLYFLEYGKACDALKKARERKTKLEARL